MRTNFRDEQLRDPHMRDAEQALRSCVHCGFCTATCPTYVLLGDERDSPRGRIMLMQQMLESDTPPTAETVLHLDRCLSCLGCRTACPSGVDYAALIDKARAHIEERYRRPLIDRLFRSFILFVLTRPTLFAALFGISRLCRPVLSRLPGRIGAMARKHPAKRRSTFDGSVRSGPLPALRADLPREQGGKASNGAVRVVLLPGCVQRALAPEIDAAAIRVLACDDLRVERLTKTGCCGALAYHLGKVEIAKDYARSVIRTFESERAEHGVPAVLMTASGCSAFMKDYGRVFADEPEWKERAQAFAAKVKDFVELAKLHASANPEVAQAPLIAFHPPCSLQHGQHIHGRGEALLEAAGFRLAAIPDAHLCCGSAGSYSLLQPEIAGSLREKKLADIASTGAAAIASDNIGCLAHLSGEIPVVHIAELLDWATGGPNPL